MSTEHKDNKNGIEEGEQRPPDEQKKEYDVDEQEPPRGKGTTELLLMHDTGRLGWV